MNTGWIKLHRSLMHWEWADVPEMMALWIHLILSASYEGREYHGTILEAGQLVTSHHALAEKTGLSVKQVRLCMARLVESGQITTERAGKRQLVTISNYKQFQELENEKGQEKGNEKADKGQQKGTKRADKGQVHINKEVKKVKKERSKEDNNPLTPLQGDAPEKPAEQKPAAHAVTRYDRVFEKVYQHMTGDSFAWSKRENVAVQTIVGKIVKMMEDAGKVPTDDDKEAALRWYLESLYQVGDDWIRSNFTPHVISDKFNEFYQTIKLNKTNGKRNNTSGNPTGVSEEYLQRIATELAG